MKQELNLEKLKDAKFTFDKEAFKARTLHCDDCNVKMKQVNIEMSLPENFLTVRLSVFRCRQCKKEYLNFEEAHKLDRALLLSRLMRYDSFKIRKSLSFDGDNYIFRIPVDIARNLGKKPYAEMIPLSSRDLLIHLDKE